MATANDIGFEVVKTIEEIGTRVRFKYYTVSGGSAVYDDEVVLSKSGNDYWTSGAIQPIQQYQNSSDAILMAQGKIIQNDIKMYICGSVPTSGVFKVGTGSPPTAEYSIVPDGIVSWDIGGQIAYKKIYLRRLTTGSLYGE